MRSCSATFPSGPPLSLGGLQFPDSSCIWDVDASEIELWFALTGQPVRANRVGALNRVDFEVDVREDRCKRLDYQRIRLGRWPTPIEAAEVAELSLADSFGARTSRRLRTPARAQPGHSTQTDC